MATRYFSRILGQFLLFAFANITFALPALAQIDPNPNSPVPLLISESEFQNIQKPTSATVKKDTFKNVKPGSKINFYVLNVDLTAGEGANAFRIYAEDDKGLNFRFPVVGLTPLKNPEGSFLITVHLKNELNREKQPLKITNLVFRLTWRGVISNGVKVSREMNSENSSGSSLLIEITKENAVGKKEADEADFVGYRYSGDRRRFLEQATFGPTAESDLRLRRLGLRTWLGEQFDAPYPGISNPYPDLALKSGVIDIGCSIYLPAEEKRVCDRDFYSMYRVQNWFFKEALYGEAQLRHRIAWALSQTWVISGKTTQQARHMFEYHKVLSQNAFGNYRILMKEMTLNPGMGNYLDMARSHAFGPNENYAREILQLFTIGLFRLNQDGTLILDSEGRPIPTYDQQTVNNFTKIFTGWTFCNDGNNPACPNATVGTVNFIDPMILVQESHDPNPKTLLDYPNSIYRNIPAGQSGEIDLDQALDNIFFHPNVGPFVSRVLIQHLVTSDPTPAYVSRVAAAFNDNGFGVRGDMKSVVRAILLDPEARGDIKTDPFYGKLREPVSLITNVLRNFNVRSADGLRQSDGVIANVSKKMGQDPFNATTVFNYFSPGYIIPGTAYNAPEFGIMTSATSISRVNFANKFTFEKILPGQDIPDGTSIDLSGLISLAQRDESGAMLVDELDRRLMHGAMSSQMRGKLFTGINAVPSNFPEVRALNSIYLVISSSQYQIQR